ncbi:uncharacterized protein LOC129716819 [Wyeomyia smithii]|uniref:uncharacterized protein LOC129716819 n=1 Tax=Wyeomyia smithii TaxID=174621 RepID=UPI0024680294|nr:uncharacterized protein LOC129716819 [Wyeomyia smithii]
MIKIERGLDDSLSNLDQFVSGFDKNRDQPKISSRLDRLETLFSEFRTNRAKIESRQEQDLNLKSDTSDPKGKQVKLDVDAANKSNRLSFENRYFDLKDFLLSHPAKPTAVAAPSPVSVPCQPLASRIHLPVFKIPSFDGSVKDWLSFRDAFQSMIDKEPSLTAFDKFNYLLTVLTKDARTLVESIEVTAANYEVAWSMLQERFDNKKIIARTLIDGFLEAEPKRKESFDALVHLIDSFERNLLQLKKFGLQPEEWSHLLAHLLYRRLDSDTQRHWERTHKSREVPRYEELLKFLREHLATLQPLSESKQRNRDHRHETVKPPSRPRIESTLTTTAVTNKPCPFCQKPSHSPFKCDSFQKLNPNQRLETVKRMSLCINCLSSSHMVRACSSSACRVCGNKHHTMLHIRPSNNSQAQRHESNQTQTTVTPPNRANDATNYIESPPQSQTFATSQMLLKPMQPELSPSRSAVFLSTAVVKLADYKGNTLLARILLDCCSERNLISEQLAQKLMLRRQDDPLSFQGVSSTPAKSKQSAMVKVLSRCSDYCTDLRFHILPEFKPIIPSNHVPVSTWKIPSSLCLADPHFYEPHQIDAIIGAEVYYHLLLGGFVTLGVSMPILKETVFGWIVSGKCDTTPDQQTALTMVCSNAELEHQLTRFWELDTCHSENALSIEERLCEAHFSNTTFRDSSGRFVVSLPKKETILAQLGDSFAIALRRYLSLERRLQAKPLLKEAYASFIREYELLGHMSPVDPTKDSLLQTNPYYMPHHCIERPDSATTKLRVVFDASCATDTGLSLNDALMVGHNEQDDLYSIILRFRRHRYAVVADLEKMYRQVLVHPSDRHLQRILWRDSPTDPIQCYELLTVTYGTASAPFLATRCLQQLATEGKSTHSRAAKALLKNFYINVLFGGTDTEEEGTELCSQLISLLQSAGFNLHKWASNNPNIIKNIPAELRENRDALEIDSSSSPVKTLGLLWQPFEDVFRFKVPEWPERSAITKRSVLSDAARLFDPLGLLGPTVLISKLFMQRLWALKLAWDVPLDEPLQRSWKEFCEDLEILRTFSVPRWAAPCMSETNLELHGFCDASERAYGACLFSRTVTATGTITVHLLTAKSKVAP